MRVLIASGGTGGHFYPGYALADELGRRGHESLFLLRKGDPAGPRLDALSLPWTELDMSGLPRRPSAEWLRVFWKSAKALKACRDLVRAWKPDVMAGMGGYLTLPAALAARSRRVPVVLHESNAVLGLANRLAAPLARAVAYGLPQARGGPGALIGTPLRPELLEPAEASAARRALGLDPARPTLLVVGGSQGARALNGVVPKAAGAAADVLQVLHLAGAGASGPVREAYAAAGVRAVVLDYLDGMQRAFAAADLAVCRAGATTAAELAAMRVPALLVPYPFAAEGHQEVNARVLEAAGAAECWLEASLDPARLGARIKALLDDPDARRRMGEAYSKLGLPAARDSARLLADLVVSAKS